MTLSARRCVGRTLALLALLGAADVAGAAGLRDVGDGWLLGGRAVAALLDADDVPEAAGPWVIAGQTHLFGVPDLPVSALRCGWAGVRGRWAVESRWQRTGTDMFRADRTGLRLCVGDSPRFGFAVDRMILDLNDNTPLKHTGLAATGGWSLSWPNGWIDVSARLPVTGMAPWRVSGGRDPWLAATVVGAGYGLAVAIDRGADGTPSWGLEAALRLHASLACCLRSDPGTGTIGPGLVWRRGRVRIRTSHLVHPALGTTHRFEVGLGRPGASPW